MRFSIASYTIDTREPFGECAMTDDTIPTGDDNKRMDSTLVLSFVALMLIGAGLGLLLLG